MDDMIPADKITFSVRARAEVKPACFGIGEVDFRRFRECCSEGSKAYADVVNVMREWIVSGFCEQCQISVFGRKSQQPVDMMGGVQ